MFSADNYEQLNSLCTVLGCDGHDLFPMLWLPKESIDLYLSTISDDSVHLGAYGNRIKYFSSKLKVQKFNF